MQSVLKAKLYILSTLNIDLILWHSQLIACAENVKSWFKSWGFPFTFQAYILPQTHKSMSFIWIVWSTLYVYLWWESKSLKRKWKVLDLMIRNLGKLLTKPISVFLWYAQWVENLFIELPPSFSYFSFCDFNI